MARCRATCDGGDCDGPDGPVIAPIQLDGHVPEAGCEFCPNETPVCWKEMRRCVECTTSEHCSGATPICSGHSCVPCQADDDCPIDAPRCESDGSCSGCSEDGDCRDEAPLCDEARCVQCREEGDCAADSPYCSAGTCLACERDEHCLSGRCEDGACRGCETDEACAKGICSPDGACVDCVGDEDCENGACTALGTCVGCLEDSHCGVGLRCDQDAQVCEPCDPAGSPATLACLARDEVAVFVAKGGDDSGTGEREAPVASIQRGVALAAELAKPWVFVCAGEYDETVEIRAGVGLHGGFGCPDGDSPWVFSADNAVRVAPTTGGPALRVLGAAEAVRIEHVTLQAADGGSPGASSVGAVVGQSAAVAMTRVEVIAGQGAAGGAGDAEPFTYPPAEALVGADALELTGGVRSVVECPGGDSSAGGRGGDGGALPEAGGDGSPALSGGMGSTVDECLADNMGGKNGASGAAGAAGAGAVAFGGIEADGWVPGAGQRGRAGTVGQGGGGGAGGESGGGGAGGAGGCGGAGGAGGQGGGGSIALLVFESVLTLDEVSLVSGDGGAGGAGEPGQAGQSPGGLGGNRTGNGCNGGAGGTGGMGGVGGGGAGGLSAGIVMRSADIAQNEVRVSVGAPGARGTADHAGIDGQAAAEIELP